MFWGIPVLTQYDVLIIGPDFIMMYRLSVLDLVKDGQTWEDILSAAKMLEAEGVDILNCGKFMLDFRFVKINLKGNID